MVSRITLVYDEMNVNVFPDGSVMLLLPQDIPPITLSRMQFVEIADAIILATDWLYGRPTTKDKPAEPKSAGKSTGVPSSMTMRG